MRACLAGHRRPGFSNPVTGQPASETLFRDACESCRTIEAMSDVHAPSDYRQHLAAVLSRRALEKAHQRVQRAG